MSRTSRLLIVEENPYQGGTVASIVDSIVDSVAAAIAALLAY